MDILLLNETKYTSKDNPKIKNYTIYRKETANSAGGVAFMIKNSVPHKKLNISNNITLEAIGIKLQSGINLISVYRSPNIVNIVK